MTAEVIERIVRSLIVALMNSMLYFPKHRRVTEAAKEMIDALQDYFAKEPTLLLAVRDNMLIIEGIPLYDLSIFAHRLIDALNTRNAGGMYLENGLTGEEVSDFLKALLDKNNTTVSEINGELKRAGVFHIYLREELVGEDAEINGVDFSKLKNLTMNNSIGKELYTNALTVIQNLMVELKNSSHVSFNATRDMAEELVHALRTNRTPFISLTTVKNYDTFTFNHSINVCVYMTIIAEKLTTSNEELVDIAQAALLHDIGKLLIPDEILYKTSSLTREEWEIMQQHPVMGAKILLNSDGVNELAVNVAFGHHLGFSRKGYPHLSRNICIDPITQLVNVVDVYEALTAKRSYKKSYLPEEAAKLLLEGAGKEFCPLCVETFLESFGVFPAGTKVCLNDGSTGLVESINPQMPMYPVVKMTHDPDGYKIEEKIVIDTSEHDSEGNHHVSVVSSIM